MTHEEETELKSCPVCGSDAKIEFDKYSFMYTAFCQKLDCLHSITCGVENAVVKWWNNQPRIDKLEEQLKDLAEQSVISGNIIQKQVKQLKGKDYAIDQANESVARWIKWHNQKGKHIKEIMALFECHVDGWEESCGSRTLKANLDKILAGEKIES